MALIFFSKHLIFGKDTTIKMNFFFNQQEQIQETEGTKRKELTI